MASNKKAGITAGKFIDVHEPNLFREQFPYSQVPRILFENSVVVPDMPEDIWITDTTFRDGQQARSPYSPRQILHIFDLLHKLGGRNGVIRQSEFFLYSQRDREAAESCLGRGYKFPEVTGWIRANSEDFKLVKEMGLKETGILTSVSDYHIFLKMRKTRSKVMDQYLGIVKDALSEGIIPRCHFEDITRADILGFCVPFAKELLSLSRESGIPVKIRLCDTMGYGISFPEAVLPRSIPKLVQAFRRDAGYPSELLEWHGHNDFHKVHINAVTAWLYGVSSLNASVLGFGERTGNPPLEGAIIEYIGLTGNNNGIDTRTITEIAEYYRKEIKADIPTNYPFAGKEFNTTRAGIHADGILKNEEIYNIFDTDAILDRPLKVTVTDKSGVAGIARWLNEYGREYMKDFEPIGKRHPGVKRIYHWVTEQYNRGRTTGISTEEMIVQARHHLPSMFESNFTQAQKEAIAIAKRLADKISRSTQMKLRDPEKLEAFLTEVMKEEASIQLLAVTDTNGFRISQVHTQRGEKRHFRNLKNKDFKQSEWFIQVLNTGEPYCSDLFFSKYTNILVLTIAIPVFNPQGDVTAVIDFDFKFDELVKLINNLTVDIIEERE